MHEVAEGESEQGDVAGGGRGGDDDDDNGGRDLSIPRSRAMAGANGRWRWSLGGGKGVAGGY
jgi:hypothetical protein